MTPGRRHLVAGLLVGGFALPAPAMQASTSDVMRYAESRIEGPAAILRLHGELPPRDSATDLWAAFDAARDSIEQIDIGHLEGDNEILRQAFAIKVITKIAGALNDTCALHFDQVARDHVTAMTPSRDKAMRLNDRLEMELADDVNEVTRTALSGVNESQAADDLSYATDLGCQIRDRDPYAASVAHAIRHGVEAARPVDTSTAHDVAQSMSCAIGDELRSLSR